MLRKNPIFFHFPYEGVFSATKNIRFVHWAISKHISSQTNWIIILIKIKIIIIFILVVVIIIIFICFVFLSKFNLSWSECGIRENFDANEYPKIFVSKNLHERISEYIRIKNFTRTNVRINICIENCMNIQIFVYFLHSSTLTHECPNISVLTNLTQTNIRIYS